MKTFACSTIATALLSLCLINSGFSADGPAEAVVAQPHIAMQDGKLWVMKDGKTAELKEETTLNDGSKVMVDGSVVAKDGDKQMLKEGEAITWDGKIMKHKKVMKEGAKDAKEAQKDAEKAAEKAAEGKK